jgi:hypothetical protein
MMNKLPNLVIIKLFTTKGIRNSADMKALLDILEFFPEFTPQKWGKDGKPKQAYARDEMIANFLTRDGGDLFFRNQKLKYEGSFPTSISGKLDYFSLDIEPQTEEHVQHIFELGNQLAEFFEPIYGSVHPIWRLGTPGSQKFSEPGSISLVEFEDGGPLGLTARNWFDPKLIKSLSRKPFEDSGGILRWMNYGGLQLDLVQDPASSTFESLVSKQIEVTNNLKDLNIFGDYTKILSIKSGENWSKIFK